MAVIDKLSIHQFRNLTNQFITPSKGINLFVANNAQGKTSLIEAIYYLGHNRSFKTKTIKEVINFDCDQFQISAQVGDNRIKLEKSKNKNTISVNHQRVNNTSQLSQILPTQIITPDKGFVVNGTPKNKRSYLDWGVFHVKQDSVKAFKTYNKTLKNINTLLINNQAESLDFWFLELAKVSATINQNRLNYLHQLKQTSLSEQSKSLEMLIDSLDQFDYQFSSGWPKEVEITNEQNIYQYLNKNKPALLKAKYLNYGSHKANIDYMFNNKKECFLSRGEQKTLSIIFWLTQVLLLINLKTKPIVLIDDLSSELDSKKINIILQYLQSLKVQTFMTDIGHNLSTISSVNPLVFQIDNGVIKQHD